MARRYDQAMMWTAAHKEWLLDRPTNASTACSNPSKPTTSAASEPGATTESTDKLKMLVWDD